MRGNRMTHRSAMALRELGHHVVQGCQGFDEPGQRAYEGGAEAAERPADDEEEARSDEEEEDYETYLRDREPFDNDYIELCM